MSEDEQEVLSRLVEADDLELIIHGWAKLESPNIKFGDLRVTIQFRLAFNHPPVPTPVHYFDLELRTRAGKTLVKKRMTLEPHLEVCRGMVVDLAWDIAIDHMDPAFVKAIKPGAVGLTSRRIDRDTKERTEQGNMQLDSEKKVLLHVVEEGAKRIRKDDAAKVAKVSKED